MNVGTAERDSGFACVSQERKEGCVPEPGRRVFCFAAEHDLRRFLYKQDRDRRFAVHREYFPQRMAGLPRIAELSKAAFTVKVKSKSKTRPALRVTLTM